VFRSKATRLWVVASPEEHYSAGFRSRISTCHKGCPVCSRCFFVHSWLPITPHRRPHSLLSCCLFINMQPELNVVSSTYLNTLFDHILLCSPNLSVRPGWLAAVAQWKHLHATVPCNEGTRLATMNSLPLLIFASSLHCKVLKNTSFVVMQAITLRSTTG
jgi:hypothetical protein